MSRFNIHGVAGRLTNHPRWMIRVIQLALFVLAGVFAVILRFDFTLPPQYRLYLLAELCALVPAKVLVFALFRMDRGWWRYASIGDVTRLAAANVAGSALGSAALLRFGPNGFPRSVYFLDFLLCLGMTAGVRIAARLAFEFSRLPDLGSQKRTLIYGAGEAGITLLREIRQNPALSYEIVGFIDDDPAKIGSFICRVKVFGNGAASPSIVASQAIEMVLIALPSATGPQMAAILKHCLDAGVVYKTVPGLGEIIESSGLISQIRDVAVEDLLGRIPVRLDESAIRAKLEGHVVVVTGAAGSIGSEICRQVARFQPRAIVGFEIAETPLFHLEQEMLAAFPGVPFHPEIGNIMDPLRLAEVFEEYRPSILYHAAAYKHVPMMESAVFSAVENNILGASNVAHAAAAYGVADFVMISSDKAVRPTSVMGLTKRASELLIGSLQDGLTKFVSVRFGNVLGSNGSVIPIFKKQIAAGGPITVTHPAMRRYFMTIPEAVQLVLQASTMGKGGEIFVLDMGQPVKILDLARNLILLSGLRPDEDIRIQITGLRPGEKLYEELHSQDEDTLPTFHEKIKIFAGPAIERGKLEARLRRLRHFLVVRDVSRLILELKDLVPEYSPSLHILNEVVEGTHSAAVTALAASPEPFASVGRPN